MLCSEVHELELKVTTMAAETGDARDDGYADKLDQRGRWEGSGLHRGFFWCCQTWRRHGGVDARMGYGDVQEEVDEDALREEDVADPARVDANVVEGDDGEAAWGGTDGDDMRPRSSRRSSAAL